MTDVLFHAAFKGVIVA